ncbi:hypothetical protein QWJ34_01290 [Saccharibacillus sp. CPCC 101409]|uniref:hypothetical protein n=1 Tax=Saccharibacillus sp. CPCC 101409 TaxID=3058041 RepID=UPI002671392A|nr:hypothetical protein [Saccharibacillus sp. CPCC 101409]MDO3408394.1 hypothetical protein [Saccharibacillus sp. CPCC 101409]
MPTRSRSTQDILTQPLTLEQIQELQQDNRITAVLPIGLDEVSNLSPDELTDLLSLKLVDSDLLTDIQYERAGVQDEATVLLKVSGDVTTLLEAMELFADYADDEEEIE